MQKISRFHLGLILCGCVAFATGFGAGGDVFANVANVFTALQTFNGGTTSAGPETHNGPVAFANQSFATTGTISATSGAMVSFASGGSSAQTLTFAASGWLTGDIVFVQNLSSNSVTLAAQSGNTINGNSTISLRSTSNTQPSFACMMYNGAATEWQIISYGCSGTFGGYFQGTVTTGGTLNLNGSIIVAQQTLTASGTIAATSSSGTVVFLGGSSASQTATLPTPSLGAPFRVINTQATNSWTLAPGGSATLNLTANASGTLTVVAGNITIPSGGEVDVLAQVAGTAGVWSAK